MCMYCKEPLTLDPNLEGQEFDEALNKKSKTNAQTPMLALKSAGI